MSPRAPDSLLILLGALALFAALHLLPALVDTLLARIRRR